MNSVRTFEEVNLVRGRVKGYDLCERVYGMLREGGVMDDGDVMRRLGDVNTIRGGGALRRLYKGSDGVALRLVVMFDPSQRKILVKHLWACRDCENEAFERFFDSNEVLYVQPMNYETRRKTYQFEFLSAKRYLARTMVDTRESILSMISCANGVLTSDEVEERFGTWGRCALHQLTQTRVVNKKKGVLSIRTDATRYCGGCAHCKPTEEGMCVCVCGARDGMCNALTLGLVTDGKAEGKCDRWMVRL